MVGVVGARAEVLAGFVARQDGGQAATEEISNSARSLWESTADALPRVGIAVGIVVIGWVVGRGARWILLRQLERSRTPSFAKVMSKLVGWAVVFTSVLLAVALTFPSVKPVDILAGLGVFSIAIGFAFQDILENTLAGVLLLFRQPFRAGDQIAVVDQSGTVAEINIRETRLTTFEGELVIVPNRDVYKNVILVHTHFGAHRLHFDVGISYDDDPAAAADAIVDALRYVPGIAPEPLPEAMVRELRASTVVIRAMLWTDSRQYESMSTLHAAIIAVKRRLDEDGIEMPNDILTVRASAGLDGALGADRPSA